MITVWAGTNLWLVPAVAQAIDTSKVKIAAVHALHARMAVSTSGDLLGLRPGDVTLSKIDAAPDSMHLWRAEVWIHSHSPPLLLGSYRGEVFRLGGFESPEIMELTRAIGGRADGVEELVRRARTFAYLLDRNGAEMLVWRSDSGGRVLDARSRQAGRESLPQDTVFQSGHITLIRMTVFSRAVYVPREPWQALSYAFVFDGDGKLLSWSQRSGGFFP